MCIRHEYKVGIRKLNHTRSARAVQGGCPSGQANAYKMCWQDVNGRPNLQAARLHLVVNHCACLAHGADLRSHSQVVRVLLIGLQRSFIGKG